MPGVLKAAASNIIRLVVVMACQFVLVPITVRTLGTETYGVYSLALSVLGFFGLLEFGAGTAAVKYAAVARGNGDTETRNRAISTLLVLSWGSSLVATTLVVCGAWAFPVTFGVPGTLAGQAIAALLILGARSAFLAWPAGVYRSALFGDNHIGTVNGVQIVTNIGLTVTTWIFLRQGYGLVGVASSSLFWFAVEAGSYVVLAHKLVPSFRVSLKWFDRALFRQVLSLSVSQLLIAVSGMVLLRTDPIIVGAFLPLAAVGQYGVALKISENVFQLIKQYVNALSPAIARLHGMGDEQGLRDLYVSASRHATLVACSLVVATVPWADRLLLAWVGKDMLPAAPVLAILSLSMAFMAPQMVASNVLTFSGHHMMTARFSIAGMIVNVAASVTLVHFMGLSGVAAGTLVAVILVDLLYSTYLTNRVLGVRESTYWLQALARPFVASIPVLVAVQMLKTILPPLRLVPTLGICFLTVAVYGIVYFTLVAAKDDREKLYWVTRKAMRRA